MSICRREEVIVFDPLEWSAYLRIAKVERANLSMRMHMRRFTRLTNGSSRKWSNLNAMLALYL